MEIYQFSENTAIREMTSLYYHVSFIIHNCLVLKVSKALGAQLQDGASNFVFLHPVNQHSYIRAKQDSTKYS